MRLSEAIRQGAQAWPPARGGWMSGPGRCALGCACEAAGIAAVEYPNWQATIDYDALANRWPMLTTRVVCPDELSGARLDLMAAVWRLNDHCGWTRERIAEWVERIEHESVAVGAH